MKYTNAVLQLKEFTIDIEDISYIERLGSDKGWNPEKSYIHLKNRDMIDVCETKEYITELIIKNLKGNN